MSRSCGSTQARKFGQDLESKLVGQQLEAVSRSAAERFEAVSRSAAQRLVAESKSVAQ